MAAPLDSLEAASTGTAASGRLPSLPGTPRAPDDHLERIATFEASVRPWLVTRVLRVVGRSALFAWCYRRIGPVVDTWLARHPSLSAFSGARLYGMPALLITTTGARTGLPRSSPLLYLRDGEDFAVVGTNFGQASHPAWSTNLLATPRATVLIGPVSIPVTAHLLDEAGFALRWPKFVAMYPGYAGYLARSGRVPRMFLLTPAV